MSERSQGSSLLCPFADLVPATLVIGPCLRPGPRQFRATKVALLAPDCTPRSHWLEKVHKEDLREEQLRGRERPRHLVTSSSPFNFFLVEGCFQEAAAPPPMPGSEAFLDAEENPEARGLWIHVLLRREVFSP